jgi:hypothetical protein
MLGSEFRIKHGGESWAFLTTQLGTSIALTPNWCW